MFYFARNLHDHVAAVVANIRAAEVPPFLDRSVHYDRLTAVQVHTLREYARAAAMRVLLDVNKLAQEMTDATPESEPNHSCRINFGVSALRAAQLVAIQAEGSATSPHARMISVRSTATGRMEVTSTKSALSASAVSNSATPIGTIAGKGSVTHRTRQRDSPVVGLCCFFPNRSAGLLIDNHGLHSD